MNKGLLLIVSVLIAGLPTLLGAGPAEDLAEIRNYYKQRFPEHNLMDFADGIYALDQTRRTEWEQIMEFPPFELTLAEGEKLFKTPFANGASYASCFRNGGKDIAQDYPYWDSASGMIKTIELEINECRTQNGEKPYKYKKGPLVSVSSYIHSLSAGKPTNVRVPEGDAGAMEAYNKGKQFYYARRGQLNFSCGHCHFEGSGKYIRANILSPAVGQTTHWPSYRSKWGAVGTIQRRYTGCNKQVRAKPFKAQSEEYRNLQYFHTFMSNDIPLNAPGTRF